MLHRRLNIVLVIFSIAFLAIFLGYWLRKSYLEAKESLKNELEVSLRKINQEVNDSQLKNIFMFVTDTLKNLEFHGSSDSNLVMHHHSDYSKDFGDHITKKRITTGGVKVYVDAKKVNVIDSSKIKQNFRFNLKRDSVEITELFTFKTEDLNKIDSVWRIKLSEAQLPEDFKIREVKSDQISDSLYIIVKEKDYFSENEYQAIFSNYHLYLYKRIFPQLTISFLLLSTVLAAFYFVFRSLREQEKLGKLKNDFISNMTHELKTPISTVGVAIEALQNFDALSSPEKTKEYLGIAGNELSRLSILVDKVLKMSQFDSAHAPMGKMTINDFKDILENVSTSMKLQLEKYNASLNISVAEGNYPIKGDKVHLANIIYNLLDNALKYGGTKPSVQVRLAQTMDNVLLTVTDQGLGIAKEYQDKIFDQFFRVPKGNLHNVKGYGLGLSYVANVVRAHGGKISLRSEENKGSEFIIELPKYV